VAISPDVVSFIHRHFGCFDLLWRSGIRNVARKASSVTPTTGMVATPSRKAEALAPVPRPRPGLLILCRLSWRPRRCCPVLSWIEFAEKETTFVSNSEAARHRAKASFKKKELQVREGAKAMADYEAVGRAVEKKTARLKALRLAKEEAARQAAAAKKSGPPR
jgi:hypothetical protein